MTKRSKDNYREEILAAKNYTEFKEKLSHSHCKLCPLSLARTHIVVDRGNPDARVVIVGEAPGENEDLAAKAFVGRAGRLLDKMLGSLGFDTNQDSLIVNVVKCRPPKNRRPGSEEALACSAYLEKQIDLVNPKILLLLGATAVKHLLPDLEKIRMRDLVGKFFSHSSFPSAELMLIYHPAFLLRDPRKQPETLESLKEFKKHFDLLSCRG